MTPDDFPFCHKEIGSILAAPTCRECRSYQKHLILDGAQVSIRFPASSSMDDLIALAQESEDYIFRNKKFGHHCQELFSNDLVAFCLSSDENPATTTATGLLALNALESSIRHSTGFATGRAPLLKTMVESIPDEQIGLACQLLLLPQGLNLRNLIWYDLEAAMLCLEKSKSFFYSFNIHHLLSYRHGFVSHLPRPWLALVLILHSALQQEKRTGFETTQVVKVVDLRSIPGLKSVIDCDIDMQEAFYTVQAWLPESHHGLWRLTFKWYTEKIRPVSTMAMLCTLLEHGLRLEWCLYNNRPSDLAARPGSFYVTLDGHGQRHVHDLLLHPYLFSGCSRNHLVENLPGSATALLTDLFCSSCGGPNIRSAVSHGVWDSFLADEWNTTKQTDSQTPLLWDTAKAVLVGIVWSASKKEASYVPVFSFSAVSRRRLLEARAAVQKLEQIQWSEHYEKYYKVSTQEFGAVSEDCLRLGARHTFDNFLNVGQSQVAWSVDDVFAEHELNIKLTGANAARSLLEDIASATDDHIGHLQEAIKYLESLDGKSSKRKYRRSLRVVHSSQIAYALYSFAIQIAEIGLMQELGGDVRIERSTALKAVERSRMVVSTVETFLHSNADRAFNSIKQYMAGRAIKDILCLGSGGTVA
eukprot:scaffold3281_cov129-Cylindrotheca_fusiformis.AAC.14